MAPGFRLGLGWAFFRGSLTSSGVTPFVRLCVGVPRLDDADASCIHVCMRTTLNLDEALLAEAGDLVGMTEKTALLHEGLRALIQREAAARLAALGGKDRKAAAPPRRKAASRR